MQAAEETQHNGDSHGAPAAENAQKIDAVEAQSQALEQAESNGKEAGKLGEESANGGAEGTQTVSGAEDDSTAKRKRSDSQPEIEDNDAKRAYTEYEEASKQPPSVDYTEHLTQLYQDAGEISAIPPGPPVLDLHIAHTETLPDGQIRELIDCPQDKVGSLIGTRGAVIQDMQTRCGCKIYIDQNFPEGAPRKVILTGSRVSVDHAKKLIALVMRDGPTALHMLHGPVVSQTIDCPQQVVGRVIGASGATIRDLQTRCGCRIQIDQNFPEGHPRKITFTGTPDAVAMGIYMVQQVMEHGPSATMFTAPGAAPAAPAPGMQQYGMPAPVEAPAPGPGIPMPTRDGSGMIYPPTMLGNGMQHQIVECPKPIIGRIIGRGGETINLIQQKSQCRVQIDQKVPDGMPCKINLTGVPQAVQLAADLVQEVMTTGPSRLHFMPSYQPMPTQGYYGYGGQPMYGYGQPAGYPPAQMYGAQQPYQAAGYPPQAAAGGYPSAGYSQPGQQAYGQPQQQPQQHYPQQSAAPAPAPAGGAASVWTEHTTDDGHKYWYNSQTGQSQWERPAGI